MDEYKQLLLNERNRRQSLIERRNELTKEVEEINRQILGVTQAIEGYEFILKEDSARIPMVPDAETMGFTEAVRSIFNGTVTPLFPTDIRDRMSKAGYEKTSSKTLLIHVHNVIERLLKSGEIEIVEIDGRSAYQWKGPRRFPRENVAMKAALESLSGSVLPPVPKVGKGRK